MHLILERETLLHATAAATKIVEARNTIPILDHVLLRADTDADGPALTLAATDTERWLSRHLPAVAVEAPGGACVPAQGLHRLAQAAAPGSQIRLTESGGRLTAQAGRARFVLPTLPPEDWPEPKPFTDPQQFEIPAAEFARLLGRAAVAMSREETRYYLNGVYLHVHHAAAGGPRLTAVATDGHRLVRTAMPAPAGADEAFHKPGGGPPFGVIVPAKTVRLLTAMLDGLEDKPVRLAVTEERVRAELADAALITRLIEGTFPDYGRVIPDRGDQVLRVGRAELEALARRIVAFSAKESGVPRAMALRFAPDRLTALAGETAGAAARDDLEAEWTGPEDFEIGLNGGYLTDLLAAGAGAGVVLHASDPGSPIRLEFPDDPAGPDATLMVLMPARITAPEIPE